jgi:hypothetical protein
MDSEEGNVNELLASAQPPPLHPFLGLNSGPSRRTQEQPPALVSQMPHRHQHGMRSADGLFANANAPLINVLPTTPTNRSKAPEEHPSSVERNSSELVYSVPQPSTSPPSSPVPMAISPTTSFAQLGSSRRHVVFGPRANCDKCRLGAPGHFAHYE